MITQDDIPIKNQMKENRRQLFFRDQDEQENTERVISSMNAARRSMGIAEIQ